MTHEKFKLIEPFIIGIALVLIFAGAILIAHL